MSQKFSKKMFHISMIIIILTIIGFVAMMMMLKYDTDGETDMPFYVSKISIISTIDGQDVENTSNKWDLIVSQNNDIYIYIEKSEEYSKTEIIDSIVINNFKIVEEPKKGNVFFYKPSKNEVSIFENLEEHKSNELVFEGSKSSNLQDMQISNQGGIVAFRCSNNSLGEYISNDEEEIEYTSLLKKINIKTEEIKAKFSFDMIIKLKTGVSFKASGIEVEIPYEDIALQGKTSTDITNLKSIVFKRNEN